MFVLPHLTTTGVSYQWKSSLKNNDQPVDRAIGVIAQEVEKRVPEAVKTSNFAATVRPFAHHSLRS